jgi:hypothetical protein
MGDVTKNGTRRVVAPFAERGVYWALGTKGGKPSVFAIDSKGEEIERLELKNDSWEHAEAVIEYLWQMLDMRNPQAELVSRPPLVLVKPELPSTAKRPRPDIYDPYAESPFPPMRPPW